LGEEEGREENRGEYKENKRRKVKIEGRRGNRFQREKHFYS